MVCYARPATRLAVIVIVALLVFGRPLSHFFDTAAVMAAIAVATGAGAVAAVLVFTAFLSTRRRRAAAGGCVSCQFRCQHAMTEPSRTGRPRRLWLVSTADRREPAPAQPRPGVPGRPVPVFLSGPRWPDRPVHRSGEARPSPAGQRPSPASQQEHAGSPG
jgi:hypothetical protein